MDINDSSGLDKDDVPPLEDMGEMFQKCLNLHTQSKSKSCLLEPKTSEEQHKFETVQNLLGSATLDVSKKAQGTPFQQHEQGGSKSSDTYCGFQKGFLLNKSSAKNKKGNRQKSNDDIIEIKSDNTMQTPNVLPEVQEAMQAQSSPVFQSKAWVTDDLLEKILKNPRLSEKFLHPRFNDALSLFQQEPQKAMQVCKDDPEMAEFIQEFCSLMGEHFTQLAEKQAQEEGSSAATFASPVSSTEFQEKMPHLQHPLLVPTVTNKTTAGTKLSSVPPTSSSSPQTSKSEAFSSTSNASPSNSDLDDRQPVAEGESSTSKYTQRAVQTDEMDEQVKNILTNPDLVEILKDGEVQRLFALLRTDPIKGQRYLQCSNLELRQKIQVLINAGLLQIAR